MKFKLQKFILPILAIALLSGCKAYQDITYLQDAGVDAFLTDSVLAPVPDAVLKVGDLLVITVNATTPEAAQPFNLQLIPSQSLRNYDPTGTGLSVIGSSGSLQNYLVDTDGNIIFPIIGKIQVAGMTKNELTESLKSQIYPRYIKEEPIISIRYANFRVSVLGEVVRPSSYKIDNERISIFEAISMAGDLTIYGRRDNVLLIREQGAGRAKIRIDLRDRRLVDSPYFYLEQNDILYIQPNDPKSRASRLSTAEALSVSLVGTLISLTSLLVNILR